jgi:hypothetical protein
MFSRSVRSFELPASSVHLYTDRWSRRRAYVFMFAASALCWVAMAEIWNALS